MTNDLVVVPDIAFELTFYANPIIRFQRYVTRELRMDMTTRNVKSAYVAVTPYWKEEKMDRINSMKDVYWAIRKHLPLYQQRAYKKDRLIRGPVNFNKNLMQDIELISIQQHEFEKSEHAVSYYYLQGLLNEEDHKRFIKVEEQKLETQPMRKNEKPWVITFEKMTISSSFIAYLKEKLKIIHDEESEIFEANRKYKGYSPEKYKRLTKIMLYLEDVASMINPNNVTHEQYIEQKAERLLKTDLNEWLNHVKQQTGSKDWIPNRNEEDARKRRQEKYGG